MREDRKEFARGKRYDGAPQVPNHSWEINHRTSEARAGCSLGPFFDWIRISHACCWHSGVTFESYFIFIAHVIKFLSVPQRFQKLSHARLMLDSEKPHRKPDSSLVVFKNNFSVLPPRCTPTITIVETEFWIHFLHKEATPQIKITESVVYFKKTPRRSKKSVNSFHKIFLLHHYFVIQTC